MTLIAAVVLATSVFAKSIKIHGYVTAVHSQTSFELDDYRIMRDESLTLDFDTDEDEDNKTDYPRDIRVGTEIEIKGDFSEETRELKAKSVKVLTRESKKLKRSALINQVPELERKGSYWEGTLRLDGQTLVIDETTQVLIVPNTIQKPPSEEVQSYVRILGERLIPASLRGLQVPTQTASRSSSMLRMKNT